MSEARVDGEYGRCAANGFTVKCWEAWWGGGEGECLRLRRCRSAWGEVADVEAES
jgi:hypothetical protein